MIARRTAISGIAAAILFAAREAGAEPAANQVTDNLLKHLEKTYPVTQPETLLSVIGACAGFGCQMMVREAVRRGKIPEKQAFVVIQTQDGGVFYFGDQLNQPLLEAPMSVWAQVAGAVQSLGKIPPDIHDIVRFVASSVGGDTFGSLRVAKDHQPSEEPIESLRRQWPNGQAWLRETGFDPMFTGWYFGTAAQKIILSAKDSLDPVVAAQIVMEAAVAMAKIDPKTIGVTV